MSVEIRCKCGWNSQVSDFYLGDRVTCPQCGVKLQVHINSNVPYGYPPYQDWAKQHSVGVCPLRIPQPRSRSMDLLARREDPHAGAALALGISSLLMLFTGCGAPIGVIMAMFGIRSAVQSRRWNEMVGRPHNGRADGGLVLSIMTLVLGALMLCVVVAKMERSYCPPPRSGQPIIVPSGPTTTPPVPPIHRYPDAPPANTVPEPGKRYPVVPKPVTPRNDFERKQLKYSQKVREERQQSPRTPKPGYRYSK